MVDNDPEIVASSINPEKTMTTSSFLSGLRAHAWLPLVFRSGSATVPAGYHLTEVKSVTYRTMDCGAARHDWTETQFELWTPAGAGADASRGHMAADKFLRIVDRVQRELPLDPEAEARVFGSFGPHPAALHAITGIEQEGHELVVSLAPDAARCKASEREAAQGGCGCNSAAPASAGRAVACCA